MIIPNLANTNHDSLNHVFSVSRTLKIAVLKRLPNVRSTEPFPRFPLSTIEPTHVDIREFRGIRKAMFFRSMLLHPVQYTQLIERHDPAGDSTPAR